MYNIMKNKHLHLFLFCLAALLASGRAMGQTDSPSEDTILTETNEYPSEETVPAEENHEWISSYHPKPVAAVPKREISAENWRDAEQNLDYSKDVPKPPQKQKEDSPSRHINGVDWTAGSRFFGLIAQALAVILALGAILYWITRLMQAPKNKRIATDGTEITAENIDAYIHETDLERFLREALQAGHYSLAIRLYYLMVIKALSEKGNIRWSREKTNRDYLREMRSHHLGNTFRELTREYERVWYGNQAPDARHFESLQSDFKTLLGQI